MTAHALIELGWLALGCSLVYAAEMAEVIGEVPGTFEAPGPEEEQ